MIEIEIPGRGTYRLRYLVLDVNGTIAVAGQLVEGVAGRVAVETLNAADVVPHVNAALDLLLNPLRLVATLRR
jgi:hypothetical protein